VLSLIAAGLFFAGIYYAVESSKDDVKQLVVSLRNDHRIQKGITLADAGFVRRSNNELDGFAVFKLGLREYVKACIATRDRSNGQFAYICY